MKQGIKYYGTSSISHHLELVLGHQAELSEWTDVAAKYSNKIVNKGDLLVLLVQIKS